MFTRAATARLPLKNRSKWLSSGRRPPVIQRQSADPACAISAPSSKRRPMTTQIRICVSTKLALDLNTESENLTQLNKIVALIGHYTASTASSTVPLEWRKLATI